MTHIAVNWQTESTDNCFHVPGLRHLLRVCCVVADRVISVGRRTAPDENLQRSVWTIWQPGTRLQRAEVRHHPGKFCHAQCVDCKYRNNLARHFLSVVNSWSFNVYTHFIPSEIIFFPHSLIFKSCYVYVFFCMYNIVKLKFNKCVHCYNTKLPDILNIPPCHAIYEHPSVCPMKNICSNTTSF